jgi:hypothetical protein
VTNEFKVSFHIGKYRDEILCDVIPMDAFHLLLERPWKFHRCVVHDWRKITYTIMKDENQIQLLSLKD